MEQHNRKCFVVDSRCRKMLEHFRSHKNDKILIKIYSSLPGKQGYINGGQSNQGQVEIIWKIHQQKEILLVSTLAILPPPLSQI